MVKPKTENTRRWRAKYPKKARESRMKTYVLKRIREATGLATEAIPKDLVDTQLALHKLRAKIRAEQGKGQPHCETCTCIRSK